MSPAKPAVAAAVAFALLAPASQSMLGWGQSAAEFSDAGDRTLRAAGWAFSIWGLIYTGLVAFAVHQWRDRTDAFARVRWAAAAAALGCGLWIVAAGLDARWLTVPIIALSAVAAILAARNARPAAQTSRTHRILALWPLSLLAGWLTIATLVNLLTVLTSEGYVPDGARTGAALAGIAAAVLIAATVGLAGRLTVYLLPVIWGLAGVAAAAREDGQPTVMAAALLAAGLLALLAAWRFFADRAGVAPAPAGHSAAPR